MNGNALRRIHLGPVRLAPPIVAALLAVHGCSPAPSTPTPPLQVGTIAVSTTEPSAQATLPSMGGDEGECSHDYFPSELGTTWEIAGTNRMFGAYQKSSTITVSSDDGFVVTSDFVDGSGSFSLAYSCSEEGLTLLDPLGQSSSAVATGPSGTATVTTLAQSGITLPADLEGASTWQQYVKWEAQGDGTVLHGDTTFNYVSRGVEVVTVPFGTFEAIRVDTDILGTLEGEDMVACQYTTWMAKDIGAIKGEMSCSGADDSIELVSFDSP